MPTKYIKKLKGFTKEGFIDIFNKSNTKVECLTLLCEYTKRNQHTVRKWLRRYGLFDLYDKLYHPTTNLIPGNSHKGLKQKEINYWKSLVSNSNTYKEVFDKHSNNSNGYPIRSHGTLWKYTKPNFPITLSNVNPKVRIRRNILKMISKQLRYMGTCRKKSLDDILGMDFDNFTKYIESKFNNELNWDNYGSVWAIHHIVPRTLCETPTDVYLLNRYNNLMPLTLSENCNQSHSIVPSQLNEWHHSNERIQKIQTKLEL
jgi:hypothetical protein